MSLAIFGSQYVANVTSRNYSISGIPAGYTLSSVVLPSGWSVSSTGPIVAGDQSFIFTVGISSGTIIITYINSGITQFITLDVYVGACKMGEEITQDAISISANPNKQSVLPVICTINRCPFILSVFADPTNPTIDLNNDKSDFYFPADAGTNTVTMILQKFVGGSWINKETISDNTYGNFFAFGTAPDFSGNSFTDDFGRQYTGIFLNWLSVFNSFGGGLYRMQISFVDIFSITNTYFSSSYYMLYQYNCSIIDGSVRISTLNIGLRGTLNDNTKQIDYYTGWYGQLRLKGILLYKSSSYNKEYNQYGDSDFNSFKPLILEQVPKYALDIKPVPGWLIWYFSTYILQADSILISDYNSKNRLPFVNHPVMNDGDFTLEPNGLVDINGKINAPLKISLSYGQNNLRKRNST